MKHLNLKRNPINIGQNRFKVNRLQYLSETYLPPTMYTHVDNVKRAFVYGKNQYIGAVTPNTMDSAKFSRQIVKQADPDYLILGGFNNYSMGLLLNEKPSLVLEQEDLFCKDLLSRYMSDMESQEVTGGVFHPQNKIFYQLDDRYRQIWTNDYMTAGINALENEESKVLFGTPSTTVTIEDLMIRIDLRQLESMYFQVLSTLRTTGRDQFIYANKILEVWIRQLAKEKFKNTLFTKTMLYQAAVFRSCAKLGKSNLILCDRFFVDEIRHFMEKSSTEANSLYRQYLSDKDHPDYENYRKTLELPRAEILKKFYLLSYLVDKSALEWIQRGHNVMRDSVFSRMFPRMSSNQMQKSIYRDAQQYHKVLLDVQTQFITNNLKFGPIQIPKRLQLQQQLQVMEDREPDFPVQFEVHCQKKDIVESLQKQKVWEIMEEMLTSEKRLRDLQLLLQFKEGKYSQQNITLYSKVLGEAKIKTKSPIKLPLFHFKNFSGYFKEVMRDIYLENEYGLKKARLPQEPLKITTRTDVTTEQIEEMLKHKLEGGVLQSSDPEERPYQQTLTTQQAIKQWAQSEPFSTDSRNKSN